MDAPLKRCGWLRRRWHARVRRLDVTTLYLPLVARVRRGELPVQLAMNAWELHKSMPGQEHWHCECATVEHVRLLVGRRR